MTTLIPNRCAYGMISSSGTANKTTILLNTGNYPSYSNYLNTTLTFPGSGTPNWSQVSVNNSSFVDPSGPLPTRINAVMSWDGYNVMLFGGQESSSLGGILEDTWTLANATTWSQAAPTTVPFGRYNAEAAYLAGTGVVMFGGEIVGQLVNESWIWNGNTKAWSQVTSTNNQSSWPSARIGHCIAASSTQVIMFGGRGNNSQNNSTWSFASGAWTQLTPTTPPSVRSEAAMAYDATANVFVLFGGQNEYNYLDETWVLSSTGTAWTKVTGAMPSGRISAQMSYDSTLGKVVLFGGIDATSNCPTNDTWEFIYNSGTPSLSSWTQL